MSTHILQGKYELIERVGVGGMAEVYKARLLSPNNLSKIVALKRILPYHCADKGFVHMFLDEARIALALNHPNIGQIYELGQLDDTWFLVMEFIDGPNLSMAIKKLRKTGHRFPPALALSISAQLCQALHAAHTQPDEHGHPMQIIHRDVSPHNVMVSRDGSVKLIDFGIAKARHRLVQTSTGTVRGKLLYMSPEQATSRPLSPQSDLFSVGMLLLSLLYGQHIWRGLDEVAVLMSLRTWSPPAVAPLCPELSGEEAAALQQIIQRAMAFEPAERYADAEAMRADLARLLARMDPGLSPLRLGAFVTGVMEGRLEGALPPLEEPAPAERWAEEPAPPEPRPEAPDPFVGVETRRISREAVLEAVRQHQDATANARMERTTNLRPDTITVVQRHTEGTETGVDQLMAEGELLGDDPVEAPPPMEASQTVRAALPLGPARPRAVAPPPQRGALWGARAPLMAAAALFLLAFGLGATFLLWQALFDIGEPAAEAEAPRVGAQIQVDSSPSGAHILIDGIKQREVTPARIAGLTPGPHTLTLEWEGEAVHTQHFTLTPDAALNFFAELQPRIAALSPPPQGAAGAPDAGPAGSPDAGAAPDVDEIWITEADPEPPRPADDDKSATLLLMATPQASVEVDGEPLPDQAGPEAPLEITPLQRGRVYKIKVQRRGYETQELSVRMDQARVEEHVRLKRKQEFGYLTLTSTPWAEVFIDNKRVASSTPLRSHRLPVGTHNVTLKNPAQKLQKSLQVEIKPNETIQRRIQL
jgi:hypothetical protein